MASEGKMLHPVCFNCPGVPAVKAFIRNNGRRVWRCARCIEAMKKANEQRRVAA